MKFESTRSISNYGGYVIVFNNSQQGIDIVLRAGTEADRYPYCESQTSSYQIRGMDGCSSMGTGGGAGIEWRENGIHYSVGGIGNSMEAVIQFAESLEGLDYQSWQRKFAEAVASTRTRIEFASGTTSSTSAYQELAGGDSNEYILGVLAGQELTINVAPYTFADSGNFVLNISGIDGSVLVSEAAHTNSWSGTLPATQDYVIRVTNQGNAAQYQLKVTVPWRIKLAVGETSTTLEGRFATGMDSNVYLLQGQAGQTITVATTSPNNNACLTIAAQMTDGSYIPLVNSASHPTTTWSDILPTGTEYAQDYSISVSSCPETPATDTLYTLFVSIVD
jgi:hypothetical protein